MDSVSAMTIRHPMYGCLILGALPGPLTVKDGEDVVGIAEDMAAAVKMAKKRWRESASIFDDVPRSWDRPVKQ